MGIKRVKREWAGNNYFYHDTIGRRMIKRLRKWLTGEEGRLTRWKGIKKLILNVHRIHLTSLVQCKANTYKIGSMVQVQLGEPPTK